MSTLSELRVNTRVQYLKIDPNAKVWDNNTLDYYVNRGYTKVQQDFQYSMPECQTSTTISTVSGTTEYDKPSDFVKITGLFDNSAELGSTTKQDTLKTGSGTSKPSMYYIYGSKIGLYPTPDSTYTLDLLYNKKLEKLTSTQDSEMTEDMEDLVILWACYLMLLSVEKVEKAQLILGQYGMAKDALVGQVLDDDDGISFSIQRTQNTYRDDTL